MSEDKPTLEPVASPDDYVRIADAMSNKLSRLKAMDYDKLYAELSELNVKISSDPTLSGLSKELQRIQSAKDRVAEIVKDSVQNYLVRDRIATVLTKGWVRFSNAKSSDMREAEAQLKLSQFIESAAEAEAFYKGSLQILKNLDSQHEIVSRRLSCFNLVLKLRDLRGYSSDQDLLNVFQTSIQPGDENPQARSPDGNYGDDYDKSLENWSQLEN